MTDAGVVRPANADDELVQRNLWVSFIQKWTPVALVAAGAAMAATGVAADVLGVGGLRGIGPNQFALALSGCAVLLAGAALMAPARGRQVAEWLLVAAAAAGAAFAADLLVVNGLPEPAAKYGLLAVIGFCLVVLAVAQESRTEGWLGGLWANVASLDRAEVGKFLVIAAQFGLLVVVVQQFRLETQAFYQNVIQLAFYGFLIHYLLPVRYRQSYFILLSLAALGGILGFANTAWLVAIGLGLIGLCHLPVSHALRVALLLAAGALLVAMRTGWVQAGWLDVLWPVMASMFMFRLIIYVYDLKNGKAKPTLASTLAYFFMLPNVVFPFFPVVDYSTFRRTYFNDEQHRIYQTGLQWMLRGVLQLVAYRAINYYVATAPAEVTNTAELVRYLVANFALYIRISGQFHVIIGLLHLFGFNLPETHHLYFLASSFTDLWRRINIYWKDFMLKVFYYPTYFRVRRWGPMASLVFATAFVFFLTWFFHAYQWFWLRGTFLLTVPDVVFWLILAVLVVINTLYEARHSRKRALGQRTRTAKDIAGGALKAGATFCVMAVLWALWSSGSLQEWGALMAVVEPTWQDAGLLLLSFVAVAALFALLIWAQAPAAPGARRGAGDGAFFKTAGLTGSATLLLFLVGTPMVNSRIGGVAGNVVRDLTLNRLSDREAALLQQGYYEDLVGVSGFNSELWEIYTKRPTGWVSIRDTEVVRLTNDNLIFELVPSTTISFNGTTLTTNRWGMRDRDYEQTPLPDTCRIALTGPSFVMGLGVNDGQDFGWLLEDRLNEEYGGQRYAGYEILNFAVPGYSAVQDLLQLEQTGLSFQPDALFFMAHQREEEAVVRYLADRVSVGAELPYADLTALIRSAGVAPGTPKSEAERRLMPVGAELLAWTYQHLVQVSRANGVLPVWIFMPTLEDPLQDSEVVHLTSLAEQAGFVTLNLADAYAGQDEAAIVVAYWDKHPNTKGHQLIAERFYQVLQEKWAEIPLFE